MFRAFGLIRHTGNGFPKTIEINPRRFLSTKLNASKGMKGRGRLISRMERIWPGNRYPL